MAIEKSEAFILHTLNFGEQDKLVTLFTQDKGILKGIAKGARKFGNRFGSSLEPMSYVRIVYYEKESRDLVTISQCELLESFFEIQTNVAMSFTLSYFSELINEFFPIRSKEDIVFRLLQKILQALNKGGNRELLSAYFEAWLLKISGIIPDFGRCRKCGESIGKESWISLGKDGVFCGSCTPHNKDKTPEGLISFLSWIKQNPPPEGDVLSFPEEEIRKIRRTLQQLLVFHMEKEPKSLRFIK